MCLPLLRVAVNALQRGPHQATPMILFWGEQACYESSAMHWP